MWKRLMCRSLTRFSWSAIDDWSASRLERILEDVGCQSPLVCDWKFFDNRFLAHWCDCGDLASHSAQKQFEGQRTRYCRGSCRRNRMETRARWRVQEFSSFQIALQYVSVSGVPTLGALLRFLSSAHLDGLLQSIMLIFTFMDVMTGLVTVKVSKIWNSEEQEWQWKLTTILTTLSFPGITLMLFFMCSVTYDHVCSGLFWRFEISVTLVSLEHIYLSEGNRWSSQCDSTIFHDKFQNNSSLRLQGFLCLISGLVPFCAFCAEMFFNMSSPVATSVLMSLRFLNCCRRDSCIHIRRDVNHTWRSSNLQWRTTIGGAASCTVSASSGFCIFVFPIWFFIRGWRSTEWCFSDWCSALRWLLMAVRLWSWRVAVPFCWSVLDHSEQANYCSVRYVGPSRTSHGRFQQEQLDTPCASLNWLAGLRLDSGEKAKSPSPM